MTGAARRTEGPHEAGTDQQAIERPGNDSEAPPGPAR
eukprot:CAMPEP_0179338062 /NCGR_PEP_ID=MMETSP0797-20121207/67978_1 /TAXON_ID=47934 /ORGANISM="Dinophysis acuminata, Strain DAEP01" /LENGTH=36 /DNA_ID= /DNA_START= /DNA_END= /DNA_ORIENTATION=